MQTISGHISSSFEMRSVKNSVMSFCSPVFSGCLSMVYTLQKLFGLYAFRSLSWNNTLASLTSTNGMIFKHFTSKLIKNKLAICFK